MTDQNKNQKDVIVSPSENEHVLLEFSEEELVCKEDDTEEQRQKRKDVLRLVGEIARSGRNSAIRVRVAMGAEVIDLDLDV